LDATHEFAFNPLVVGSGNHNLAFKYLELKAVREVAPFYFGVGQVPQREFLLIQVLQSEQLYPLCLRLDYVVIRGHDSLDLADFIIADRKKLVCLDIPHL
jgi:hypothetical protein